MLLSSIIIKAEAWPLLVGEIQNQIQHLRILWQEYFYRINIFKSLKDH